jgi:hypothetical protein
MSGQRVFLYAASAFLSLLFFTLFFFLSSPAVAASFTNLALKKAVLTIDKQKPTVDKLTGQGEFQLGAGGAADPALESVTLSIGPFSQTVPPNSFSKKETRRKTTWTFKGAKGGLTKLTIVQDRGKWTFNATGAGLTLANVTNPIPISLQIGDDSGSVSQFFVVTDTAKKTVFKFPPGRKDDADGDGKSAKEGDCDDQDPTIYPGAPELCNATDDDCDVSIDEDFDLGTTCTAGVGACQQSGVKVCAPDEEGTVCNVTVGTPIAELCGNGVDDDCDGETDEGFDVGATCIAGIGDCARLGVKVCVADGNGTVCDATPGEPSTEVCNRADDDCNSIPDNGFDVGTSCTTGTGGCENAGVKVCAADGLTTVCNATPGNPQPEICGNEIDENCDGIDPACAVAIAITNPPNLSTFNLSLMAITGTVAAAATEVRCNGASAGINANGFGATISLKEGSNTITCVATDAAGNAGTASITVSLDTAPPRVTIDSPRNEATLTASPITVTGMVNDIVMGTVNSEEARVTCNGVNAQVANRAFVAANVPLNPGANSITCTGIDRAGNVDTARVTVTLDTSALAKISIVSGNNQIGRIGEPLPDPLVVSLTDDAGNPVTDKKVIFKVIENDGTLSGGENGGRALIVTTDANGHAQTLFTLGTRAGAGNNRVEATAVGFAGEANFTATALPADPANIVVDSGNNQEGAVSQSLPRPFVTIVIDQGNNRLKDVPVTFTMTQGGGNFAGQSVVTVTTDSDGRAAAVFTLGDEEGFDNNLIEVTFPGNSGAPATFVASGRIAGSPTDTRVSGVVVDNSNVPIPGATIRIEETSLSTQTDDQGQFALQPAPVGHVKFIVDGTTIPPRDGLPWPTLEYELVTIAGRDNTIGMPIYLLPIDEPNGMLVDETNGGTLTLSEAPGFELTILPGSATFPDGSKRGKVSVTAVHADKVPMVPNFGQQPRFIITIQPAGTHFNPPAAMTLPNVDTLPPGQKTEMYSFDHDLGSFVSIGTGTVSGDGMAIRSDPGVGVIKGGWHCGGNPPQTGDTCSCDDRNRCTADTCTKKGCVYTPLGDGQSCAPIDAGSCQVAICEGGRCVTEIQKPDGEFCDDSQFCTSHSGRNPGPDLCESRRCIGKKISDQDEGGVTPVELDFTKLKKAIEGTAAAVSLAAECKPSASLSGGVKINFFERCCEQTAAVLQGKKYAGFVKLDLKGEECGGPIATILGLVSVKVFVGAKLSGSLGGGGDSNPCGDCNWFVQGNVAGEVSGGVKLENKLAPDVISVKGAAKGKGSLSSTIKCGKGKIEGCAGPVTIGVEVVLGGFFKKSAEYTLPHSTLCGAESVEL